MLNKPFYFRFVSSCYSGIRIILAGLVLSVCVSGNSVAETLPFKNIDVRFNGNLVYKHSTFLPMHDLSIECGVDAFSEIVKFFSFISSQTKPMSEDKTEKKGN